MIDTLVRRLVARAARLRVCASASLLCTWPLHAYADPATSTELADLSLQQLSELEVTSVSKMAELLSAAPASIYAGRGGVQPDEMHHSGR